MEKKTYWHIIIGGIIVIAAAAIMLPALISLLFGIGRLILTIALIILVTVGISFLQIKYKQRQLKSVAANNPTKTNEQ